MVKIENIYIASREIPIDHIDINMILYLKSFNWILWKHIDELITKGMNTFIVNKLHIRKKLWNKKRRGSLRENNKAGNNEKETDNLKK